MKSLYNPQFDDFVSGIPDHAREILERLNHLLLSYPGIHCKIRFRIPFYDCKSWICYLNPLKKGAVELVFLRGNELIDESGLLEARGRKMVKGIVINDAENIPFEAINQIFLQALMLDETASSIGERIKEARRKKKSQS
jgi:hypothetical protein